MPPRPETNGDGGGLVGLAELVTERAEDGGAFRRRRHLSQMSPPPLDDADPGRSPLEAFFLTRLGW